MKPLNSSFTFAPRIAGSSRASSTIRSMSSRTRSAVLPIITPTRRPSLARVATLLFHSPPSKVPRLTLTGWLTPRKLGVDVLRAVHLALIGLEALPDRHAGLDRVHAGLLVPHMRGAAGDGDPAQTTPTSAE